MHCQYLHLLDSRCTCLLHLGLHGSLARSGCGWCGKVWTRIGFPDLSGAGTDSERIFHLGYPLLCYAIGKYADYLVLMYYLPTLNYVQCLRFSQFYWYFLLLGARSRYRVLLRGVSHYWNCWQLVRKTFASQEKSCPDHLYHSIHSRYSNVYQRTYLTLVRNINLYSTKPFTFIGRDLSLPNHGLLFCFWIVTPLDLFLWNNCRLLVLWRESLLWQYWRNDGQ